MEQLHKDIMYLAGFLLHRSAQTEEERAAAEYISGRMKEYTSQVEMDLFYAIESYPFLFASFYSEFVMVGILAHWWPGFAAVYGLGVWAAYLLECLGYSLFSRLMPQYESQNVVARFAAPQACKTLIITAHYDSGFESILSHPRLLPWLRWFHRALVACMLAVIATCVIDALDQSPESVAPMLWHLRWVAIAVLGATAVGLFLQGPEVGDVRGANNNASGVAALLRIARQLQSRPLEHLDVWLVATGSHESWMGGARHFAAKQAPPVSESYWLNLESVGSGGLHYLREEGLMHRGSAAPELLDAAAREAGAFQASPAVLRSVPLGSQVPMTRGYKTMTIISLGEDGLPCNWNSEEDKVTALDEALIARAADFADAIIRRLDAAEAG